MKAQNGFMCGFVLVMMSVVGCSPAGPSGGNGGGNDNTSIGQSDNDSNGNESAAEQEGFCDGGSISVLAELRGGGRGTTGTMEYREFTNGCKEFITRVEQFRSGPGTFDLHVSDILVGQIVVDDEGSGEAIYSTELGNFPPEFPTPTRGDSGDIDGEVTGEFEGNCPPEPQVCAGVDDNGGGGGSGGDDEVDIEGYFRLRLTIRSISGGAMFLDGATVIDDVGYGRVDAPINVSAVYSRWYGVDPDTNLEDPKVIDYQVEAGKTVTIMAFEWDSTTAGAGTGSADVDLSLFKSNSAVYFVGWEGDNGDATPEEGVIQFVMNRDVDVDAVFDIMPLIVFGKFNETYPDLYSGGCFDFYMETAPYLTLPPTPAMPRVQTATCISGGTHGEVVIYGQLKLGTLISLTAVDIPPGTSEVFNRWEGGGCGGGTECAIDVGDSDVQAIAYWRGP